MIDAFGVDCATRRTPRKSPVAARRFSTAFDWGSGMCHLSSPGYAVQVSAAADEDGVAGECGGCD